ncbi:hypothetical protein FI667_g13245, partial [Globisporangium splendens]
MREARANHLLGRIKPPYLYSHALHDEHRERDETQHDLHERREAAAEQLALLRVLLVAADRRRRRLPFAAHLGCGLLLLHLPALERLQVEEARVHEEPPAARAGVPAAAHRGARRTAECAAVRRSFIHVFDRFRLDSIPSRAYMEMLLLRDPRLRKAFDVLRQEEEQQQEQETTAQLQASGPVPSDRAAGVRAEAFLSSAAARLQVQAKSAILAASQQELPSAVESKLSAMAPQAPPGIRIKTVSFPSSKVLFVVESSLGILQNPLGQHGGKRVWGGGIVTVKKPEWVPWPIDALVREEGNRSSANNAPQASNDNDDRSLTHRVTELAFGDGLGQITRVSWGDRVANVHTAAVPPWMVQSEEEYKRCNQLSALSSTSVPRQTDKNQQHEETKREENDVLAESQVPQSLESNHEDPNWLPNFGGVWQEGPRSKTKQEFKSTLAQTTSRASVIASSTCIITTSTATNAVITTTTKTARDHTGIQEHAESFYKIDHVLQAIERLPAQTANRISHIQSGTCASTPIADHSTDTFATPRAITTTATTTFFNPSTATTKSTLVTATATAPAADRFFNCTLKYRQIARFSSQRSPTAAVGSANEHPNGRQETPVVGSEGASACENGGKEDVHKMRTTILATVQAKSRMWG